MENTEAAAKFSGICIEAQRLAQLIADHMADHMETSPDGINWGHVGDANAVLGALLQIADQFNIHPVMK